MHRFSGNRRAQLAQHVNAHGWVIGCSLVAALGLGGCSSKEDDQGFGGSSGSNQPTGGDSGHGGGNGGIGGGPAGGNGGNGGAPDPGYVPPPTGTPFIQDDTSLGGVDQGTLDQLKEGGSQELTLQYPFENTVFPAGLLPPIIQWPEGASAAYVHMAYDEYDQVDYQYAMGASNPGRLEIPAVAWESITDRATRDPLRVTVSAMINGSVRTKVTRWRIAQGRLQGSIYYNTYDSPGGEAGAIMRLNLGAQGEIFLTEQGFSNPLTGPCYGCHSVSANGETMAATWHNYFPAVFEAFTYDIGANPNPQPPRQSPDVPFGTFGALTPEGGKYLTMGNPDCTAGSDTYPRTPNNFPLVEGPANAALRDTRTGQTIQASGLDPARFMWMPQFSPDGTKVVFNDAHISGSRTNRRTLAVMDFDAATNTFSNHRVIYTDDGPTPSLPYQGHTFPAGQPIPIGAPTNCTPVTRSGTYNDTCSGPCYPGWPFFTPDGKKVIFVRGTEPDFMSATPGGRDNRANSELWMVDIDTLRARRLDNANGEGHLPPGHAGYEYFPTVMPVSAGGYYWLFWTSRRGYGNIQAPPMGEGLAGTTGHEKKIWVSAITVDRGMSEFTAENPDLSHPGFYLRGQTNSGNVRAFSALDPCVTEGQSCRTGIDCCSGFCDWDPDTNQGVCVTERECSNRYEACRGDSDCCPVPEGEQAMECLGGFCDILDLQ